MKLLKIILLGVFLCLNASENALAKTMDLSLDKAVELTLKNNENIKSAKLNIQKMQSVLNQANSARWFQINANGSYSANRIGNISQALGGSGALGENFNINTNTNYSASLGLSLYQPIYTFGKIGRSLDAAQYSIEMSKYQEALVKRELVYNVKNAYYSALLADKLLEIAQQSYNNAIKSRKLLTDDSVGRPVKSDLIRVDSDIAMRKPEIDKAKAIRNEAYRLVKIICVIEDTDVKLTSKLSQNFSKINNVSKDDIKGYPEFEVLRNQKYMFKNQGKAKQNEFSPNLSLFGNYNYSIGSQEKFLDNSFDYNNAAIGIELSVPLWDGNKAKYAGMQDYIESERVDLDLSRRQREVYQELENAVEKSNEYISVLKSQKKALSLAQESYNLSVKRFKSGNSSATELNDAEKNLTLSKQSFYSIMAELNRLKADIDRLTKKVKGEDKE